MRNRLVVLFILISTVVTGAAQPTEVDPLLKFIQIAEQENQPLEHWEVVLKETFSETDRHKFVNKFRMYERRSMIKDENSLNYLFEDMSIPQEEMTVKFKVVLPTNSARKIEVTAVISGNRWDESVKATYQEIMKDMDQTLFSGASKSFACITLQIDDIIEDRVIINPYVSELEINRMNVQQDNIQNSTIKTIIYGYTPIWDNFITIQSEPLNIQIAIIELENEKLSYKIGTPLLINEY